MRETRPSGSEGGEAQTNGPSLPLSPRHLGPEFIGDRQRVRHGTGIVIRSAVFNPSLCTATSLPGMASPDFVAPFEVIVAGLNRVNAARGKSSADRSAEQMSRLFNKRMALTESQPDSSLKVK